MTYGKRARQVGRAAWIQSSTRVSKLTHLLAQLLTWNRPDLRPPLCIIVPVNAVVTRSLLITVLWSASMATNAVETRPCSYHWRTRPPPPSVATSHCLQRHASGPAPLYLPLPLPLASSTAKSGKSTKRRCAQHDAPAPRICRWSGSTQ